MSYATIGLVFALLALIYVFLTWNFSYWKKLGVKGPAPWLIVGNYQNLFSQKRHVVYDIDELYRNYKQDEDFVGIYSSRTPQLLITSAALARRVFVTDFKHFHDNEASLFFDEKSDFMFANNPFTLTGKTWKEKRAEISPGLTLGRISLRFTSEVVTDCVLGLNADSFGKRPTPILRMISTIFDISFWDILAWSMFGIFPILKRFHKLRFIPKKTEEFFEFLMQNGIEFCKSQKKLNEQHYRVDFLNYMLHLQETKNLSISQLTAHSMTFLLEGFETTASVLAHCLLMLARHPEIQEKLRFEFDGHVDRNGVVNFEALVEFPLLDACIHEALRIFPPGFCASKICTEPIVLTNRNGSTLHVRKGEVIVLPIYSFMTDEDYYPNAQEFRPERFLAENGGLQKYRRLGAFFGFGEGPRMCLGMRFALVQTKAAIVEILRNFNIRDNSRTRKDNNFEPKHYMPLLNGGIWLDFETRI